MKLLISAVTFGKRFSALSIIGQLVTAGILLYLAFLMGTCWPSPIQDSTLSTTVQQTKEYASQLENTVETLRDTVAQKETTITTLTVQITQYQRQQREARQRITALQSDVLQERQQLAVSIPKTDTLVTVLQEQLEITEYVVTLQDSIISNRTDQVRLLNIALDSALIRGDTLERTLDVVFREHQRKNKLFGKIPLPSRKVVAITAFIGGTYLGVQAVK